ncbi:ubiquitin family protein [Tanacetum coccineum]
MIIIDVIYTSEKMVSIGTSLGLKVVEFKEELAQIYNIPANEFRLIYNGKTLEDDRTLASYGIKKYDTLHMEVAQNPLSAETETTPPCDTTTGDLGSLGLDSPTGGMPDMSLLLYDAMSQMMQTLLSSPKLMKQIIDQNPQLHDSIPQLSKMMQNPDVVSVVRRLTSPPMMQQMMSSPLLPELNQYPLGVLPPGATAVPLEQLFAAQLSYLQETRDPHT